MSEQNQNEIFAKPGAVSCQSYQAAMSRRSLLGGGIGLASMLLSPMALSQVALQKGYDGNILVVIFLRGGADGLNMVVPYREDAYFRARPTLSMKAPRDATVNEGRRTIDLDGNFGLHRALQPLEPLYKEGNLGIVHAVGSDDRTRSHFEAMATMERGATNGADGTTNGWLARYLTRTQGKNNSPFRSFAFGETVPDSLRGAPNPLVFQTVAEVKLAGSVEFQRALSQMYGEAKDEVERAGHQTMNALEKLHKVDVQGYKPNGGATYPDSDLGRGLKELACLIQSDLGVEIACIDKGLWDTHAAQGADIGWQAQLMDDLSKAMAAFAQDLGKEMNRVTVIAMTEFGRRVEENTALGTDHGRASVFFAMGGGVNGGKIFGRWPGLQPDQLDRVGDMRVGTDYRVLLSELLDTRLAGSSGVFKGSFPGLGLFHS